MMTRASRVLKWIGAGAVLMGAAPIAYADGSDPAPPDQYSALCGGGPQDFAGVYAITGAQDATFAFDVAGMRVTAADFGQVVATGSWVGGGGQIAWSLGAVGYSAAPSDLGCADVSTPGRVTSVTVHASDGETFEIHRI